MLAPTRAPDSTYERFAHGSADRFGNGWWQRVTHLPVGRCLPAAELPGIGESLQPRCHAKSQARQAIYWEVGPWRFIGKPHAVYAELQPFAFGASRTEVWAAVLLRAADQRRR